MTVQAWLIFTAAERTTAMAFNSPSAAVDPRAIDNVLANNLGEGTLVGKFVCPARLLIDPDYTAFYTYCSSLPIRTLDSDILFLPPVVLDP